MTGINHNIGHYNTLDRDYESPTVPIQEAISNIGVMRRGHHLYEEGLVDFESIKDFHYGSHYAGSGTGSISGEFSRDGNPVEVFYELRHQRSDLLVRKGSGTTYSISGLNPEHKYYLQATTADLDDMPSIIRGDIIPHPGSSKVIPAGSKYQYLDKLNPMSFIEMDSKTFADLYGEASGVLNGSLMSGKDHFEGQFDNKDYVSFATIEDSANQLKGPTVSIPGANTLYSNSFAFNCFIKVSNKNNFQWTKIFEFFGDSEKHSILGFAGTGASKITSNCLYFSTKNALDNDGWSDSVATSWEPEIGEWYMITMTYDRLSNVVSIYVNGTKVADGVNNMNDAFRNIDNNLCNIGSSTPSNGGAFPGSIRDFTLLRSKLEDGQVEELYRRYISDFSKTEIHSSLKPKSSFLLSKSLVKTISSDSLGRLDLVTNQRYGSNSTYSNSISYKPQQAAAPNTEFVSMYTGISDDKEVHYNFIGENICDKSFSINLWIKPIFRSGKNIYDQYERIFDISSEDSFSGSPDTKRLTVGFNPDGKVKVWKYVNNWADVSSTEILLDPSKFTMLTFTYNKELDQGKLYIDSELKNTFLVGLPSVMESKHLFVMSKPEDVGGNMSHRNTTGELEDLCLFREAISQEYVSELYSRYLQNQWITDAREIYSSNNKLNFLKDSNVSILVGFYDYKNTLNELSGLIYPQPNTFKETGISALKSESRFGTSTCMEVSSTPYVVNNNETNAITDGSSPLCISLWFKIVSPDPAGTFIISIFSNSSNEEYSVARNSSGKLSLYRKIPTFESFDSDTSVLINEWNNLLLTVDNSSRKMKSYLNGHYSGEIGALTSIIESMNTISFGGKVNTNPGSTIQFHNFFSGKFLPNRAFIERQYFSSVIGWESESFYGRKAIFESMGAISFFPLSEQSGLKSIIGSRQDAIGVISRSIDSETYVRPNSYPNIPELSYATNAGSQCRCHGAVGGLGAGSGYTDLTVNLWAKIDGPYSAGSSDIVLEITDNESGYWGGNVSDGIQVGFTESNGVLTLRCAHKVNNSANTWGYDLSEVKADEWFMITITLSSAKLRVSINGLSVHEFLEDHSTTTFNSRYLSLGARYGNPVSCSFKDIVSFNKELVDTEVSAIHNFYS